MCSGLPSIGDRRGFAESIPRAAARDTFDMTNTNRTTRYATIDSANTVAAPVVLRQSNGGNAKGSGGSALDRRT
jgi:hypothetical protein